MTALSYVDVYRRMAAEIDAEREAVLGLLGPSAPSVRAAVAKLLVNRTFKYPLSVLPLIVHAVETGTLEPALPLAIVHELWWTSACCLDDLADAQGTSAADELRRGDVLLATVIAGVPLPLLVVQSERVPEPVRHTLREEIVRCWINATEGQLRDLHGATADTTPDAVALAYLRKSGAPFGMITTMAAQWANASASRVALWREFGELFGVLWQLLNDQEDILSGRNEDILNGTATYLLACALDEEAPGSRERLHALHRAAQDSAPARADLAGILLAPEVLHRYRKDIDHFRGRAGHLLDALGGTKAYLSVVRDLVDQTSRMLLHPRASLEPTP
ncbi:polyprenyl synthetase family protein [Streptomyces sp. NPDC006012]|uniref:polyprenyl synthetase family protein n=1 Tax=Streptomyces sp. NPDC006012 TaxID=3364739 RepID=UPI00368F2D16